jgi:hypothetical protein
LKELKQRFTIWFNSRHKLFGTIWDGRFKSILVEDDASILRTVAAYIDLNALRARLADKPENYRWCGMAAADRGDALARGGLISVTRAQGWTEAARIYRKFVYEAGLRQVKDQPHATLNVEDIENLNTVSSLMTRQRVISEGWVIGTRRFVHEQRQAYREAIATHRKLCPG